MINQQIIGNASEYVVPGFVHPGDPGIGYHYEKERPIIDVTDGFSHRLNESGFRDNGDPDSVPSENNLKILALGCSYVFGYGIETDQCWPNQLAKMIKTVFGVSSTVTNLGIPGASNDTIVRLTTEYLEAAAPHILLVGFAQSRRLEYWKVGDTPYLVRPGSLHNPKWTPERKDIQHMFDKLSCQSNDNRRLYQSIKIVSGFSRLSSSFLMYTFSGVRSTPDVVNWTSGEGYLGFPFPLVDFAADGMHPGQYSNKVLALKSFTYLCRQALTPGKINQRVRDILKLPDVGELSDRTSVIAESGDELAVWMSPF